MESEINEWTADAADGATGETFTVATFADFLKVPEARRFVCLREFKEWLEAGKAAEGMMRLLARAVGQPDESVTFTTDVFVWIDDGKGTMNPVVRLVDKESQAVRS